MQLTDRRLPGWFRQAWATYVTETARFTDAESDAYRSITPARIINRTMVVVFLTGTVSLLVINFFAKTTGWIPGLLSQVGLDSWSGRATAAFGTSERAQLYQLTVWTGVQLVAYVVLPVAAIRWLLRLPLREFGVRLRGTSSHWRVYVALYAISLPLIVWASRSDAFLAKYPFYRLGEAENFWPVMGIWWVMYAAQFVALEFFFRGFMVHGLKGRLGYAAIFAMVLPYTMIHFGKPLAEATGAILGGITLGTLSLRTRSVWWGAALHVAVAGTMDVLALSQQGVL
ncbi:MAG: CPBP family intramembrane metalloprotease [Acidimicrobiia bacterium]|nr:CPBP family intramembrane metalloprotease [Acidimicrobiia bacterium]